MSATQVTDSVSMSCGKVEISTDGSSWTDISGEMMRFPNVDSARFVGEAYTLAGDDAIVQGGKKQPEDIVMDFIYTEADAEAYEVLRNIHETDCEGGPIYVQWSPRGGLAGHEQITSGPGAISNFQYPGMDASAGGVIVVSITFRVVNLVTTVISS